MTEDVDMDAPEIDARDIADPPMEDPDSEDDSDEMRMLKAVGLRQVDQRIHRPQLQSLQVSSPRDMVPVKAGTEFMREGFTVSPPYLDTALAIIDSVAR